MAVRCGAPWVSMRFSPDGSVHACCVNDTYPLGRVDRDRLVEVWRGERMEALRQALDLGDASLGCVDCALDEAEGRRATSHAAHYDRWDGRAGEWPLRLEFAMSNRCNLMCVHCNGELSSAIRSRREGLPPVPDRYGEQFFTDIREFLPHVEVTAFLGGEPFLGRHARRIWDDLIELARPVEVNVTTNGTIWNAEVERYLHELRMNVAVSIDSVERSTFESVRVGAELDRVNEIRDRIFEATRAYGGAFTINHCLLRENVHELYRMLADADARGMRVEVIPVSYPPVHSPFRLPAEERLALVERLRDEASRGGPLELNAAAFDAALAGLAAVDEHLDASSEVLVAISERRGTLLHPDLLLAESVAAQTALGAGAAPMHVEVLAGVVERVEVPLWAELLGAESWVGSNEEDVLAALCAQFEGEPSWDARTRWSQVTEIDLSIAGAGDTVRFRIHRLDEVVDGRARGTLVITSPDLTAPS